MSSDLVKKAIRGNKKAFEKLILLEKNKLYRMAYLYVKNENDALDIVQETIYKAYLGIKNVKETGYFSTWLTRILINTAIDFIRKNQNLIQFEDLERIPIQDQYLLEESMDLLDAVTNLEERYKTVILLRYYNDFSLKEIANMLDCPEGTVKSNLHRAINHLKSVLKRECI
ncbi:sigma-70 family RNA polymerase sigma factor [Fredinandcohnia humi]